MVTRFEFLLIKVWRMKHRDSVIPFQMVVLIYQANNDIFPLNHDFQILCSHCITVGHRWNSEGGDPAIAKTPVVDVR